MIYDNNEKSLMNMATILIKNDIMIWDFPTIDFGGVLKVYSRKDPMIFLVS